MTHFLNIIVNATHAIEDNAQNLPPQGGKIKISAHQLNTNIVIKITDNGAGMPAEVKERIFDPFYTTKGVGKGTGQGLSLAYAVIVERHKGKIEVQSTTGEGSTFIISLPIDNDIKQVEPTAELAKDFI